VSWKRPKDFPKIKNESDQNKEWSLFVSDGNILISPEDIRQGELGDCYYLSSISSIANKYPQSIDDLFITKKTNEYGIYAVYLCIDGFWRVVMVDDLFPCKDTGPIYSSSLEKELWVMILEKAWAKIFGSFSNIIAGNPREVLKALTGGITWECKTNDP
jgi:calpain-15